jgi:hypothetical protein
MWYALVYFPDLKIEKLNVFRKRYDPTWQIIEPHMPFLFIIPETVGFENLDKHVRNVLFNHDPFWVHFYGLMKTWDHWLLLQVREGAARVNQLHYELYQGILKPFHRTDLPFDPHIGLGLFADDSYDPADPGDSKFKKNKFLKAKKEAEDFNFDFWCLIDKLTLVRGENFNKPIVLKKTYSLT